MMGMGCGTPASLRAMPGGVRTLDDKARRHTVASLACPRGDRRRRRRRREQTPPRSTPSHHQRASAAHAGRHCERNGTRALALPTPRAGQADRSVYFVCWHYLRGVFSLCAPPACATGSKLLAAPRTCDGRLCDRLPSPAGGPHDGDARRVRPRTRRSPEAGLPSRVLPPGGAAGPILRVHHLHGWSRHLTSSCALPRGPPSREAAGLAARGVSNINFLRRRRRRRRRQQQRAAPPQAWRPAGNVPAILVSPGRP
jgi:hypothetical protein